MSCAPYIIRGRYASQKGILNLQTQGTTTTSVHIGDKERRLQLQSVQMDVYLTTTH